MARRNSSVDARIVVQLQPDYHVNSNTPTESYLIPLRLTWDKGALEPAEIIYPKPHLEKYEFSEKPLSVFTGKFEITTRFRVAPGAATVPGILTGRLRYQACNNSECFPPKTIEIKLPVEIQ